MTRGNAIPSLPLPPPTQEGVDGDISALLYEKATGAGVSVIRTRSDPRVPARARVFEPGF